MILKTTKNLLWMMMLVLFFSACNEAARKKLSPSKRVYLPGLAPNSTAIPSPLIGLLNCSV